LSVRFRRYLAVDRGVGEGLFTTRTRQFTLAALNAAFAAGFGRPRRHYRTAQGDPQQTLSLRRGNLSSCPFCDLRFSVIGALDEARILEAGSEGAAASEANYAAWLQQRDALRADSGGSRPAFRDDLARHSDLISLGVPR